jgi:hypothetical protein
MDLCWVVVEGRDCGSETRRVDVVVVGGGGGGCDRKIDYSD